MFPKETTEFYNSTRASMVEDTMKAPFPIFTSEGNCKSTNVLLYVIVCFYTIKPQNSYKEKKDKYYLFSRILWY